MEMNLEQKKAMAVASARLRASGGGSPSLGPKDVPDMP